MINYTASKAKTVLPQRKKNDNKTRGGKTLIIAGSKGMWGAAVLSAKASARVGAGYVYIYQPRGKMPITANPDFLFTKNIKLLQTYQAIAIGPGLSQKKYIELWLLRLKKCSHVVVDASGLAVLAKMKNLKIPPSWILTPHEGELGKMLGVPYQKIRKNRLFYIKLAQKKYGCVVLLKGHKTLISNGSKVFQISTGNPSLGKAGTGDVLTGMIAGFLSQGLPSIDAACLAATIHGSMADAWCKSKGDILSLMASDLIAMLPIELKKLRST